MPALPAHVTGPPQTGTSSDPAQWAPGPHTIWCLLAPQHLEPAAPRSSPATPWHVMPPGTWQIGRPSWPSPQALPGAHAICSPGSPQQKDPAAPSSFPPCPSQVTPPLLLPRRAPARLSLEVFAPAGVGAGVPRARASTGGAGVTRVPVHEPVLGPRTPHLSSRHSHSEQEPQAMASWAQAAVFRGSPEATDRPLTVGTEAA
mmetsp:Transcript_76665/g.217284  ORF Transcript_76665/g.217284 Transcript_76665/m.217284 type:complete len:202 (-) Transcript_76665:969-1574(-)